MYHSRIPHTANTHAHKYIHRKIKLLVFLQNINIISQKSSNIRRRVVAADYEEWRRRWRQQQQLIIMLHIIVGWQSKMIIMTTATHKQQQTAAATKTGARREPATHSVWRCSTVYKYKAVLVSRTRYTIRGGSGGSSQRMILLGGSAEKTQHIRVYSQSVVYVYTSTW